MTNKNYKVVCPPLDVVLLIRKVSLKEEQNIWEKLRTKISDAKAPIRIEEYMEAILKCFLSDPDQFFKVIDEDQRSSIITAAYNSVITLYPMFQLEWICNELNASLLGLRYKNLFSEIGQARLKDKDNQEPSNDLDLDLVILDRDRLSLIEDNLRNTIIGQDVAIDKVIDSLKIMAAGLSSFASFFFVGPTGVGKTQLARTLGKFYGGKFFKINCAEYSSGHEYSKLIGSPPGYVGHSDKSILSEKAEESSRWVFLFDEIEKAHHRFYDFLLSLLDDGTVTDNMGRELDFSDSIFIFTSNQGLADVKLGRQLGFDRSVRTYSDAKDEIKESVKKHFPPEFLNRIDEYVLFNQLSENDIRKIVSLELQEIPIKQTKSLLDYVVKGGYSKEYGARNVKRFIKSNITVKVAEAILSRLVPKREGSMYSTRIKNGELNIVDTIPYKEISDESFECDSPQTSGTK